MNDIKNKIIHHLEIDGIKYKLPKEINTNEIVSDYEISKEGINILLRLFCELFLEREENEQKN